jgi:FtsP/CotA-like multicopper oxidase with cupredoxin domain
MQTIKRNLLQLTTVFMLVASLFGAGLVPVQIAAAACLPTVIFDLYAKPGSAVLYGSTSVPIWGYSLTDGSDATLPGPELSVNQGDCVQVTLHNGLPESSALLFQGQSMIPDTTGAAAGGTQDYIFSATNPGTFLYEAGLITGKQHQVAMGLYGALIVQPTVPAAYDVEKTVVLSEFDAILAANPIGYDMRKYAPRYFLVNGKAYPDTDLPANQISASAGNNLLLRYVNAGLQAHAMSTLGLSQRAIAVDGRDFAYPHRMVSETIAPGQTLDALVTIPASAADGTKYALYDGNLLLRNTNASGLGGMLTFLTVVPSTPPPPVDVGPTVSGLGLSPNPTGGSSPSSVAVTATITDSGPLATVISAAEFYIDSTAGTAYPMSADDLAFDSSTESVTGTISTATLQALASGNHTIYVRGQDSALPTGLWGPFLSITLDLDMSGPTTSGLALSINPSNGLVSVDLSATGDDSATGNSNVTGAEFWVDSGSPAAMTIDAGPDSPVRTFTATILPPLVQGTHVVSVRSQDSFGNWGEVATIDLIVIDTTPPTTSAVSALPNPNNGTNPFNTSVPAVRVFATFDDALTGGSNIAAGEGFIDTLGATGTGFVFIATDGAFNSPTETGYADVPLPVINALSNGDHTIYVHAKDAAGNWGANDTTVLHIDKIAPTFASISLAPSPTNGVANVALTVNGAADTGGAGLGGGEYWINPPTTIPPAPGGGTQFSGLTANIPVGTLATGTYTVNVRIKDAVGNWSSIRTAPLTVWANPIFSNDFVVAAAPWGWTSRSTTNTARLNRSAASAMVGGFGLQAQGNNTNYVQFNFGTTAIPSAPTYDARFYFRPRGNTSTGKDIFSAATSSTFGTTVFRVRYRLNGSTPQVQIQVGAGNANTTWTNILGGTSNNRIEVVWRSGVNLQLYVNGTLAQTLTAGANSVGAVRLGSITTNGNATLMYFDAFASKRTISPLIGP